MHTNGNCMIMKDVDIFMLKIKNGYNSNKNNTETPIEKNYRNTKKTIKNKYKNIIEKLIKNRYTMRKKRKYESNTE